MPAENLEGQAETIGQRLRRLRRERGLSQRELSERGVSYAYISRIEAGARRPSVKALRMLARKLGVSADYLETGSEIRDTEARELRIAEAELELRLCENAQEAERNLERLRNEALEAGDAVGASRAAIALGLAAEREGRHAEAIRRLESGLSLSPVPAGARPDVHVSLGSAYAANGRPDRAVEVLEDCLHQAAGGAASGAARVRAYRSSARLHEAEGRLAAALDSIRRAIAVLEVGDGAVDVARAHLLCGSLVLSQGRVDEARRHYELAKALLGADAPPREIASVNAAQARLAARLGDEAEAVRRAEAALAAAGEERPRERGEASWALAEALALRGDLDDADAAFREAAELLEEHGLRRDYEEAQRAWGEFLRRAGREAEAVEVLERVAGSDAAPTTARTRAGL